MKAVFYQAFYALCVVVSIGGVRAADVLPQEPAFKGKIAVSTKDSTPDWPQPVMAPQGAPNIILVLLDDVGFGATGSFGGPIETPQLDRLASQGLRYNRFHVSALCAPTRAALLSGRNDHRVGFGSVDWGGFPGYNGIWPKNAASVADILRRNGYSTAAFGKWHNTPAREISPVGPFDRWPTGLGFEYFYGFMSASESQWEPALYRNTTPVDAPKTAEQGYQLTTDLADDAINWVQTHNSLAPNKPYFLYFAAGGAHEPLHATKEWIDKYRSRFDQGWDKLRAEIFVRQKKMGVIPANAELTPRPKELPDWNSLSADERKLFARQMEVYAGYLAQTDYEVGRLVQSVQAGPQGDNTIILYIVGDNGASGDGGPMGNDTVNWEEENYSATPVESARQRLAHSADLGGPAYWNLYSRGWGWATSSPFQWFKFVASHFGGTRSPLVVSWPARIKDHGGLRSQFAHVNDVAATLYEVAGIRFPAEVDGVKQKSLDGTSFAYSFEQAAAPSRHRLQIFEQLGNRAIYQDGWVAAARHTIKGACPPLLNFAEDRWELYHIDDDFSEAHDLAAQNPEKLKQLQSQFDIEARKNDIYPLGGANCLNVPTAVGNKKEFVYHSGLPRIPSGAAPDFSQPHRITADVVIPGTGAEGVILSQGSRHGGFVLYVKNSRLVYENNRFGTMGETITSTIPLPTGHIHLAYEFIEAETTDGPGKGRLYINGQIVGEVSLSNPSGGGTFSIGEARVSPVSKAYRLPFKFTGSLEKVTVQFK